MEDSSVLGAGERDGIARSWRVREGKEWTRSRAAIGQEQTSAMRLA
jgi:hypothetical protein